MIKNIGKILLKVVIFITIFAILLSNVTLVLSNKVDEMSYNPVRGFYDEAENSLDAVYIGSSNVLAYWNPLIAWKEYGINVYSYGSNALPLALTDFVVKEVRKTQPNAKLIININTLADVEDPQGLYRIFDYTPFSFEKMYYINSICDLYNLPLSEKMEYYFPIVPFHDRWTEITLEDFNTKPDGYKGSITAKNYLYTSKNQTKKYNLEADDVELSYVLQTGVTTLLDYCDAEKLDVTFVTVPQAKKSQDLGKYNAINSMIEERGYTVLNFMDKTEMLGIDPAKDFYNSKHTNIHGSLKFTHYMADYLIDTYGFEDKRGNEEYKSWDEALERYLNEIDSAVLDFEFSPDYDCTTLEAPKKLTAEAESDAITIKWNAVEDAEGYEIFERKGDKGTWKKIAETKDTSYNDKKFESKAEYFYRVVPFKTVKNEKVYGDFSYKGVNVTAKKSK